MDRYTIERILENCAVCTAGPGTVKRIPLEQLPEGAEEGVVLMESDGGYAIDEELTALNCNYMASEFFYEHEAADPEGRVGMDSLSGADLGSFGMSFGERDQQAAPGAGGAGAPGGFGGPGMGGFGGPMGGGF